MNAKKGATMKRIITAIFAITLCLSIFAGCGNDEPKEETPAAALSVGYGKVDVTPTKSIPLDGYAGKNAAQFRWSTSVEWPFYAICTAFTDAQDNTILIVTLDMLNAFMADAMRSAVSENTGVPKERIMFHCTHNHSGPALREPDPVVTDYLTQLVDGVINAAKAAMEDRKPAQVYTTFARPEGCNTVRHYLIADGSYRARLMGEVNRNEIIGHYGQADNLLQLVKFTREGGKDVVMVNWQGHPPGTEPSTIATSNYPGVLRSYLEKNLDCEAMFILGGSGNLNNNSMIAGEVRHNNYQELGQNLGAAAVEAAANFAPLDIGSILFSEQEVTLSTSAGGSKKAMLSAFSFGDFAMVAVPFEIFDTNAMAVREGSDYKMTFYSSCTNGSNQYLSTPPSFDWVPYAYEATGSGWAKGSAEIVEQTLSGMLDQLFTQRGGEPTEKPAGYVRDPFVPKSDGVTYTVPDPGAGDIYIPVQNGFYSFGLYKNNTVKKLLSKDPELIGQIFKQKEVKLLFDEQNVVVGIAE